ncbi:acyltransferase family protein [Enterococcus faecalis]
MRQIKRMKKNRYITGFDGIRTIAVISVIFYHLTPTVMKGGYLGVPIFFVLSGYLITDLLRQEWQQNGTIDLRGFYERRMRRLYPGLVTMLIGSVAYITLFQSNLLNNIRSVVASCLLYYNNWWQIFKGFSYFDAFAAQSPFTHIWSLAVEAQNYLIWPLLFLVFVQFVKKRSTIFGIVMAGAVISALLMALLYVPNADPTRVYYGTDTRLFSILLGSALAFVWPSTRLKMTIPQSARYLLNGLGIGSLLLLLLAFFMLSDHSNFVYYGGMFLVSILAMFFVAVTAHPGADLNRWLTNPIFTWVGKRSYGIYLYQFPVMIFYEAKITNLMDYLWLHSIIELALILGISDLSYRFVENPLRNFAYQDTWVKVKGFFQKPWLTSGKVTATVLTILSLVMVAGLIIAPANAINGDQEQLQKRINENQKKLEQQKNQGSTSQTTKSSTSSQTQSTTASTTSTSTETPAIVLSNEQLEIAKTMEITTIGDSVILDAAADLQAIFPKMYIDGEVGRQLYTSPELVTKLEKEGRLKNTVLVGLGTNGPFTEAQFDEFMKVIGQRQVYWVNVRVPTRRWQNEVNAMLTKMAKKYQNLTVIDWYSYSNDHEDWFYDDRVHPNVSGGRQYTNFIADKILKNRS